MMRFNDDHRRSGPKANALFNANDGIASPLNVPANAIRLGDGLQCLDSFGGMIEFHHRYH